MQSRLISGQDTCEREVRNLILEVAKASPEALTNFLPIVLDHLIKLLVTPPVVFGITIDASGTVFEAFCTVVSTIAVSGRVLLSFLASLVWLRSAEPKLI